MNTPIKGKVAGQYVPLVDGIEKVTGRAIYTADMESEDCLIGRILRSPVSHGRIISVDTSKAEALPGVVAVVTGDDSDKTYGVIPIAMNEYPMARDKVRYRGEPIAAVCAIDAATAAAALELIEVEITQGEDLDPRYVDIVGKISLEVPPGRPAGCEVTVVPATTSPSTTPSPRLRPPTARTPSPWRNPRPPEPLVPLPLE